MLFVFKRFNLFRHCMQSRDFTLDEEDIDELEQISRIYKWIQESSLPETKGGIFPPCEHCHLEHCGCIDLSSQLLIIRLHDEELAESKELLNSAHQPPTTRPKI